METENKQPVYPYYNDDSIYNFERYRLLKDSGVIKIIMDTRLSFDPDEIWIGKYSDELNYLAFYSMKHSISYIVINFPKKIKELWSDEDYEKATISGSVYIPISCPQKNYFFDYLTTPVISYNKETEDLEIRFSYTKIEQQTFLPGLFKINKKNLI